MHGDWLLGGPLGNSRCTANFPVRIADGKMQGTEGRRTERGEEGAISWKRPIGKDDNAKGRIESHNDPFAGSGS